MSYTGSPVMSNRRNSARYEEYSRSRPRNFTSGFDDYSKKSYDKGGRSRDSTDFEPSRYTRDSHNLRSGFSRPDLEEGRRQSRYGRPDCSVPPVRRERFCPPDTDPKPSKVLGVFGLSMRTEERHLDDVMSAYGPLEDIQMIYDNITGRSRGFAFVYFQNLEDARAARAACARGLELHDRVLRVDYSFTLGPHQPTPGIYMGKDKRRSNFGDRGRRVGYSDRRFGRSSGYGRSRSRTPPSPRRRISDTEPSYRRRSRMASNSRSRSPPLYNPRRREHSPEDTNGFRPRMDPPRSRSNTNRFEHDGVGRYPGGR